MRLARLNSAWQRQRIWRNTRIDSTNNEQQTSSIQGSRQQKFVCRV
jgi:hypothetical protein